MEGPYGGARAPALIAILRDFHAREDERYDAAMDLESFSGPEVEAALTETIRKEGFSSVLAQLAAESLAGIWARADRMDSDFFSELEGQAKCEVLGVLSVRAPHLISPGAAGEPGSRRPGRCQARPGGGGGS